MSEEEKTSTGAYKRILVVDDEEQVIFVLRNSLQKLGHMYEIVTAHDGREALDKIKEAPVDLVITDLAMPGMDGVTLTETVRAQDPGAKVVWVTAYDQWKEDAERLGVRRYVLKPLDVKEIRRIAQEELEAAPPTEVEPEKPVAPEAPAREKEGPTVLIMEDNPDLLRLYSKTIAKVGYTVYPAMNLSEARAHLAQHSFDVFLCDVHIGQERGPDLLQEQREVLDRDKTQIIMVSGDPHYRDICEEMGVDFYIEKPVAMPPLLTLMKRLIAFRRG